jgi:adenylyl-sulfate kinase
MEITDKEAFLLWITGLSGSGKTTIGKAVYKKLKSQNLSIVFLDGDSFRDILGNDLTHSPEDRIKNAKRISRMCNFLVNQNISVVCSTMSLYKEIHQLNKENIDNYYEVFIDCNMEELIKRDQKGLYNSAINGNVKNVVGIDLPYDEPKNCILTIDNSTKDDLDKKVNKIMDILND